ncbi:MAG: hypothetical protein PHS93_10300 [Candidatus Omnitrophica bacterium]|nr:hypothetical protein [Candidatus Omnitrophota bacterium]
MNSNFLNLNWKDFLKGLLVAVIAAFLTGAYEALQAGTIEFTWAFWQPIVIAAAGAGLAYIIKNLIQNSEGDILKKEPK